MRQAVARISSVPSAASASVASSCSTRLPGRSIRVVTRTGAIGTGRRMSTAMRASWPPSIPAAVSMARASSADGGPACWCSRLHGPRVYSVARRTSPSATYSASAFTELQQRRLRLGGVEQLDAPALLAFERTLDEIAPALVEYPLGGGERGRALAVELV